MSTTAEASAATRYPCPTGCVHADDFDAHETCIQDGRPILQHEVDFGEFVWGYVGHNFMTDEADVTVQLGDVEYPHGPKSPEELRALAARLTTAAEWLEAHR